MVFTHDLDFGALLAAAGSHGPSVIQVRAQDLLPEALAQYRGELVAGALVSIEPDRRRVRLLPLRR